MTIQPLTDDELDRLPAVVDLATAALAFGIGRTTAYRLARTGTFPVRTTKIGDRYKVAKHDLLAAIRPHPTDPRPPYEEADRL